MLYTVYREVRKIALSVELEKRHECRLATRGQNGLGIVGTEDETPNFQARNRHQPWKTPPKLGFHSDSNDLNCQYY